MKNSNRGRRVPYVRPVQRVELSESNVKARMILIVVLLSIAVVAIVTGLMSALRTEPGWNKITVESNQLNCGQDFTLNYDFTDAGSAASSEFKNLTAIYSAACEDAFLIFSPDVASDQNNNLQHLNAHPNEVVTVDPVLYRALELASAYRNRSIYLGGVYAEYDRIFRAETDVEAASYDPAQNPEQAEYLALAAKFANDPAMIDILLLDNNQVQLQIAEEYRSFAQLYEIENLIDFGWMKNAFIADYLAQVLTDNGYTKGYLASNDGFTRNLDTRGNSYSVNIFDRQPDGIYVPAVMTYNGPQSLVFLRDFPMVQQDSPRYYVFSDDRIVSMLIDPKDGMSKAGVDSLLAYSKDQGCAEILLQMIPVFISDDLNTDALLALEENGVHSIWCDDLNICYTDMQVNLAVQPQENFSYSKVFAAS